MKIYISLFLILFVSCDGSNSPDFRPRGNIDGPSEIHFSFIKEHEYPPDSLFENVSFIRLETNERCLIASYDKIMLHGDTIFVLSRSNVQKAIFAFNINGDYLFKIDSRGRGPGEYQDISDFYINNELNYIGVFQCRSRTLPFAD